MISIDIDDREIVAALRRLHDRMGAAGMRPALALIGEHLTEITKQRFAGSTGPNGSRWPANARSTLERLLAKTRGGVGKRGKINAPGRGAMMGKKPLIDSEELMTTIRWQFIDGGVAVGTDRFANLFDGGAAVHQFGSKDGRIPARPFLGVSDSDRRAILDIIEQHLAG